MVVSFACNPRTDDTTLSRSSLMFVENAPPLFSEAEEKGVVFPFPLLTAPLRRPMRAPSRRQPNPHPLTALSFIRSTRIAISPSESTHNLPHQSQPNCNMINRLTSVAFVEGLVTTAGAMVSRRTDTCQLVEPLWSNAAYEE